MINYHEKCTGIVLFKWRQRFIQLWICKRGYEIKPHSHPEEDIELMYLFGKTVFYRKHETYPDVNEVYKPKWYHVFRTFTVKAGTIHWFTVSSLPLVFINFSKFKKGYKAKSAAIDFK